METVPPRYPVSERSGLVAALPSPASTDRPSNTSNIDQYGAVRGEEIPSTTGHEMKSDSVGSFEFLLSEKESSGSTKGLSKRDRRSVRARRGIVLGLVLVVLGAVIVFRRGAPGDAVSQNPSRLPFSTLDPRSDLNLYAFQRSKDTSPPHQLRQMYSPHQALPTNAWYENLLMARGEPGNANRVYTIPYVLDMVGPVPGLRVQPIHIDATQNVMQLSTMDPYALTVGAASAVTTRVRDLEPLSKKFSVTSMTPLGITLEWDAFPMISSLVRGMPYATMHYPGSNGDHETESLLLPTIASEIPLLDKPLVDGKPSSLCSDSKMPLMPVNKELQLTFDDSDFTWVVFFSEPVLLWCMQDPPGYEPAKVIIQVTDAARIQEPSGVPARRLEELTVRVALLTNCTTGVNPLHCAMGQRSSPADTKHYGDTLRRHANSYPGPNSDVQYSFDDESDEATVRFDWDMQKMSTNWERNDKPAASSPHLKLRQAEDDSVEVDSASNDLIMFALPHHRDILSPEAMNENTKICTSSLIGPTCLVTGSEWILQEDLPPTDFRAPRPPRPETLSSLADALKEDIHFRLPSYYRRGAGDTYFSGKMLAKAGRILLIADELTELCSGHASYDEEIGSHIHADYKEACDSMALPDRHELDSMLAALRDAVEVWINGKADMPFIYDSAWGGVLSCGCLFDDQTNTCRNTFPDCPVASDPGLNFGNGFYNDHHFHYGYHIYAAAVVAYFDPSWGREYFEQVLLLVRDIANPSENDQYFPVFRHKDWFQGNSWASGITLPPVMNGRNQESSSEAIASYEAVSLFGRVMVNAWNETDSHDKAETAAQIQNVGRLLTATELRAADRYWHVRLDDPERAVYPAIYKENAVGIMWNTMAQFQTWFGNAPYLPYGIQLLPLTPISESRDDPRWLRELYEPFTDACGYNEGCIEQGWVVLQLAVLASVGHIDLAVQKTLAVPPEVFESAGGNGHSLTNTLWYISTRPAVEPVELADTDSSENSTKAKGSGKATLVDCGVPETCTDSVLAAHADGYSCRDRITYLINTFAMPETDACSQVGRDEYPEACGACDPCAGKKECSSEKVVAQCPHCSEKECHGELNRCPFYDRTYVCTGGSGTGGCSPYPWELNSVTCSKCCELTHCQVIVDAVDLAATDDEPEPEDDPRCPDCSEEVCNGRLNLCPVHRAPFLCTSGDSRGGCAPEPWDVGSTQCAKCCRVKPGCRSGT